MRDDPIELLERELLSAAQRRSTASAAVLSRPARGRPGWGALALAGSAIVVFLVAAVALVGLHGHTATRSTSGVAPAQPGPQLRALLGVLRRPQTAADRRALRHSHVLDPAGLAPAGTKIDPASGRLATITPWHAPVLVVLVDHVRVPRGGPGLLLSTGIGAGCCSSPAEVAASGDVSYETHSGPPAVTRVYAVVPDGVARVAFHAATARGGRRTTISAGVHGNVAAAQTPGPCCAGWSPFMTWYAADGRVIKVVGDVNAGGSVSPGPILIGAPPGTVVTMVPRVGSRRTTFNASFRVTRAGADYYDKLVGPAGCGGSGTGFSSTARRLDVRGRRIAIPLTPPPAGSWCPGTWTVSVGPAAQAASRIIRPAGPTFGSATFRVRR